MVQESEKLQALAAKIDELLQRLEANPDLADDLPPDEWALLYLAALVKQGPQPHPAPSPPPAEPDLLAWLKSLPKGGRFEISFPNEQESQQQQQQPLGHNQSAQTKRLEYYLQMWEQSAKNLEALGSPAGAARYREMANEVRAKLLSPEKVLAVTAAGPADTQPSHVESQPLKPGSLPERLRKRADDPKWAPLRGLLLKDADRFEKTRQQLHPDLQPAQAQKPEQTAPPKSATQPRDSSAESEAPSGPAPQHTGASRAAGRHHTYITTPEKPKPPETASEYIERLRAENRRANSEPDPPKPPEPRDPAQPINPETGRPYPWRWKTPEQLEAAEAEWLARHGGTPRLQPKSVQFNGLPFIGKVLVVAAGLVVVATIALLFRQELEKQGLLRPDLHEVRLVGHGAEVGTIRLKLLPGRLGGTWVVGYSAVSIRADRAVYRDTEIVGNVELIDKDGFVLQIVGCRVPAGSVDGRCSGLVSTETSNRTHTMRFSWP